MKLRVYLMILWASSLCGIDSFAQSQTMIFEVVGEGSGGRQITIEAVEQQARADAMRKALEQAGVYVSSITQTDLAVVSRDEIEAWTQGLVRVLELLDLKTTFDEAIKAFHCTVRLKVEVRVQDMAVLMSRVQKAQPEQADRVLGFEYLFTINRETGVGENLMAGSVVRAGDAFQIWFEPDRDCYAYVINRDASGAMYVLFPHEQAISNKLEAGHTYILPNREQAYQFDRITGTETFYLAVSPVAMVDLEWMITRIRQGEGSSMAAMLDGTLKARMRGAGAVVEGPKRQVETSGGLMREQVTQMLVGKGALVQVFTLEHR